LGYVNSNPAAYHDINSSHLRELCNVFYADASVSSVPYSAYEDEYYAAPKLNGATPSIMKYSGSDKYNPVGGFWHVFDTTY
jgi:hypothetical protein